MTREEAIDIVKCLAWHDLRPSEEVIEQAIKALEQEPNSDIRLNSDKNELNRVKNELEPTTKNDLGVDAVSRQAVLELMADYDLSMGQVVKGIHALPSVTPQEPRWIPVSEKLPKPYTFVNVTCRSLVDDRKNWVVETIYLPIPKEANKHGYSDWGNIPMLNWGEAEVIAWVERIIPQPYKAESEET